MDSRNDRVGTRVGGTKHSVLMLIFYKFLLLTPSINMEDFVAKKAVFYLYKKKNRLYAWFSLFSPFLPVFILFAKDGQLLKGLGHIHRLGFSSNIAQRQPFATNGELYKYINIIYIYTQYKTNILKCFYPIDFSNLVVRVVHLFLFLFCFLDFFFQRKKHDYKKNVSF